MFKGNKKYSLMVIVIMVASIGCNSSDHTSGNASDWYQKAFALYKKTTVSINLNDYILRDAALTVEQEQYLRKQKPIIDLMIQAVQMKNCDWGHGRYQNIWLPIDSLKAKEVRGCFRLLLADVRYVDENVPPMKLLERCEAISSFSKHLDLVDSSGLDFLVRLNVKYDAFRYIHFYLNRNPNMTTRSIEAFFKYLKTEDVFNMKKVFDTHIKFAEIALTNYTVQNFDSTAAKVMDFKGSTGRKEFFRENLEVYKEHISNLRTISKKPLVEILPGLEVSEQRHFDALEFLDNRFSNYTEESQVTKEDYEVLIKHGRYLFSSIHTPPVYQLYRSMAKVNTCRNALLTAIPLILDYHKTGELPDSVPLNLPKDAFGNSFELIKTKNGFTLNSKSIDSQEKDDHSKYKYEFILRVN
ncbi:MAG: hypothetical protein FVQ82_16740 [Planctomycetes bacterium]|nr:hypothetical protein [Planctomycetota bacterium]